MAATVKIFLGLPLLGLLVIAVMNPSANALLGGRSEVPDVHFNREVQELGRYCVEQFNSHKKGEQVNIESIAQTGTAVSVPLEFSKVESAQKQVVAGIKYYLRIEATQPDGSSRMFDSVVVIHPWLHSKQVLGFAPVVSPIY